LIGDIDAEMRKRGLDALMAIGSSTGLDARSTDLFYLAGAHLPRGGVYVMARDREAILVVSNLDVGNAKKGRVRDIRTYDDYGFLQLIKRHGREKAAVMLYDKILKRERIRGRVAILGQGDLSRAIGLVDRLRSLGHSVQGQQPPTLLDEIRATKDERELEAIRQTGEKAQRVVKHVWKLLSDCVVRHGRLIFEGRELTVGRVKEEIRLACARQNLVEIGETMFAVGPVSADPHAAGEPDTPVKPNKPIVFDFFPQYAGGYCFDVTRTFVIGGPPAEVRKMHQSVLDAQLLALDRLKAGEGAEEAMNAICDLFEGNGYRTIRDLMRGIRSAQFSGFVHSLGHGVGLTVGEAPYLGLASREILKTGHVVTVEPGLYKPGLGGVRIEDVVVIKEGGVENLTWLPKDLEI